MLSTLLSLSTMTAALVIAWMAWRQRHLLGARELVALALSLAWWTGLLVLELRTPSFAAKAWLQALAYIGVAILPVWWFVFAARVTLDPAWLRARAVLPLFVVPALTVLFALLEPQGGLFFGAVRPARGVEGALYTVGGPWWWVHTAYSYLLILAGLALLIHAWRQQRGVYRVQLGIWIAAIVLPLSVNAAQQAVRQVVEGLDLTPSVLTVTGGVVLFGLLRHRLLILSPIALETVLDSLRDGVIVLDDASRIMRCNPAARPHLRGSVRPGTDAAGAMAAWPQLAPLLTGPRSSEIQHLHLSEGALEYDLQITPIHSGRGRRIGFLLMLRDVTEMQRYQRVMRDLAFRDALTGLGNRRALLENGAVRLEAAKERGSSSALLFVDLDRFKEVNDSLGHGVGDELLQRVAERLLAQVKASDLVCRNGGDEFVVLLEDLAPAQAREVAQRLEAALERPFRLGPHEVQIGASVGVATFPDAAASIEGLMRHADKEMYRRKMRE